MTHAMAMDYGKYGIRIWYDREWILIFGIGVNLYR